MMRDRDAPAEDPAGREPVADAPVRLEQAGVTPRVVTSESLLGGATQLAILPDRTL